jgi:Nif-specific regulatory protein
MEFHPTTGIVECDRLLGGVRVGDNIVWEVDSAAPVDRLIAKFITSCAGNGNPLTYVSFNHSPQTIFTRFAHLMPRGSFTLIDCFSSGKGNNDPTFLDFVNQEELPAGLIHIARPADPAMVHEALSLQGERAGTHSSYIFDSLTGMVDLWGSEDSALRFFGHICPRLYDLSTIAYWLLEKDAHSERFRAKIRHVTQVVVEIAVTQNVRTLTVRKAADRHAAELGLPQRFDVSEGDLAIGTDSREGRELALLADMSDALGSALDRASFFERTMAALARDLGMGKGALVLLDRASGKLHIAAAHGLTARERARGEYTVGEGVTGRVVQSGLPQVVPDVGADARFLDRTGSRGAEGRKQTAFICVPLVIDGETVGALSVDRPFAQPHILEKDLRLLTIVAAVVSQALKINRILKVDKDEILEHDEALLEELKGRYKIGNVVGRSDAIRKVLAAAAQAAHSRASVLLWGETGTGKELVANVVHYNSGRSSGPFVKVNCGALSETLLESELFGHVKGAFTGAVRDRKGCFELADGGTLLLDEVVEMSPSLQVKLLRVLQDGEFSPVGSERALRTDVRVVGAANLDLREAVRQGRFRDDLYYRLNVISIHIPPLRARRDDIPLLINHFIEKYNAENGRSVTRLSQEVVDLLLGYPWPGNVRELENCIERAVVMSPAETLSPDALPEEIAMQRSRPAPPAAAGVAEEDVRKAIHAYCRGSGAGHDAMGSLVRTVEEAFIRRFLEAGVSQRDAAKALGLSRTTLRKKIHDYGIL